MATSKRPRVWSDDGMEMPFSYGSMSLGSSTAKLAKEVNSLLNDSCGRELAQTKLKDLLNSGDEDVLSENVASWLKALSRIIIQKQDLLAAENFKKILSQACQISAISREISANLVPAILISFLQEKNKIFPILSSIEAILLSYPTSCGNQRSHVVKFVLPLMTSSSDDIRAAAFRCWAMVPFLGGGGSQRSTHSRQWQSQLDEAIKALKFAFQNYIGEESEESLDPCIGSLSLPFPELPATVPEFDQVLIQRFCVLCDCLLSLLDVDFPHALPIPVTTIVKMILDILDIAPLQMGHTSEMIFRASFLCEIHGRTLQLFGKLAEICKRNLCRYSSQINRTFSALLDQWKDKSPVSGRHKKHHVIRTRIYCAILDWLQNCGATSGFLCGPKHLNRSMLKHFVEDINPVKKALQVSAPVVHTGRGKKGKKRKNAEVIKDMLSGASGDRIQNPEANEELTASVLKVCNEAITTLGHRLSPEIHNILQETIIGLMLELQHGTELVPYARCTAPRLLLYKVLLALTLSPTPYVAPPTGLTLKIFTFAISRERSPGIRSYCSDGLASLNNIIHPWRNAWHACSVVVTQSTSKKMMEDLSPTIEPMNIENGNCITMVKVGLNREKSSLNEEENLSGSEVEDESADEVVTSSLKGGDCETKHVSGDTRQGVLGQQTSSSSQVDNQSADEACVSSRLTENCSAQNIVFNSGQGNSPSFEPPPENRDSEDHSFIITSQDGERPAENSEFCINEEENLVHDDQADQMVTDSNCGSEEKEEDLKTMLLDFVDAPPDEESN